MREELEALRGQRTSSSSRAPFQTPPPRVAAPSPAKSLAGSPGKPPRPPKGVQVAEVPPPPQSEGAKLARLRRLCEIKPSGKGAVPTEVHNRWKNGDKTEREAMVEEFEKANWAKEI